jgi:serine/threonine-protein phosphatase 6 regulatory ankyrin repeat subunit B
MRAAANGGSEVVQVLLAAKADTEARSDQRETALMRAAANGHTETVKSLIAAKANVGAVDCHKHTALLHASRANPLYQNLTAIIKTIKVLVTAAPEAKDNHREALMTASCHGDPNVVEVLLDLGVDVNSTNIAGNTALMCASRLGRTETVKMLLKKGALVDALNEYRETALILASKSGKADVVQALAAAGANVNAVDYPDGNTALILASKYPATVRALLKEGADVNARGPHLFTALIQASSEGDTELAQVLLAANADVNARDNSGFTALMWACRLGHTKTAQALLKAGADITARTDYGRTVLMVATDAEQPAVVRMLLAHGVGVDLDHKVSLLEQNTKQSAYDLVNTQITQNPNNPKLKEIKQIFDEHIDQSKLSVVLGLHPRVGNKSSIHRAWQEGPLGERLILPHVFDFTYPSQPVSGPSANVASQANQPNIPAL